MIDHIAARDGTIDVNFLDAIRYRTGALKAGVTFVNEQLASQAARGELGCVTLSPSAEWPTARILAVAQAFARAGFNVQCHFTRRAFVHRENPFHDQAVTNSCHAALHEYDPSKDPLDKLTIAEPTG